MALSQRPGHWALWVDLSATKIINDQGELEGVAGVMFDITERKAIEEKLREANRELEAFVYTVSHDLRSPPCPHYRLRRSSHKALPRPPE